MDAGIREEYLSAAVFTATPERLHLMLVDGAARFAEQLREALAGGDLERAATAGERLRGILTEMITTVQRGDNALAARMRAVYFFLIRELGEGQVAGDAGRIENILKVLDVERETWQLACARQASEGTGAARGAVGAASVGSASLGAGAVDEGLGDQGLGDEGLGESLSLQA